MNLLIVPVFLSALDIGIYPLYNPKFILCICVERKVSMTLMNTKWGRGG